MFFNPEIVDEKYRKSVDELVDNVIQLCPIHTRRSLYNNICLSGGSTLFKGFKERLERRVKERVNERLRKYEEIAHTKVVLFLYSQHPSMFRCLIIPIRDTLFGWEGVFWQENQGLLKCTTPGNNMKRSDQLYVVTMLYFLIDDQI